MFLQHYDVAGGIKRIMNKAELIKLAACGEDSRHQFKADVRNVDALAAD